MALLSSILALRGDARILKLPPYLSALCIVVGIAWLLVLPLNEYSRNTYISENALLPGQVHTYFTGSEHNVFRAYRHEVATLVNKPATERSEKLGDIFRANDLKVATQKYEYRPSNRTVADENVYAVLQAPRADATEAVVLMAAWKNMAGDINYSGVALVLTLARYFKRWSLWSKDIIFLVSGDSTSGPQAWVDAYHDGHNPDTIESLEIKSGALQGAVAVDYPAGPWGHRYEKLHVVYDGVNGQLPNLDLINTAINIASGQMGIGCAIQRMWKHTDTYQERLQTMIRGMLSQGLGHATGPHSSFIPYHVDAISLVTVGDGWHDEMSLGRAIESLFRSLNNLLEHFHQSFFFYLLLQTHRFVSIGTYLPSAMLIAVNFSISSIALWVQSGRSAEPIPNPASTKPKQKGTSVKPDDPTAKEKEQEKQDVMKDSSNDKKAEPDTTTVQKDGAVAVVPTETLQITERRLFNPLIFIASLHLVSLAPLWLFNTLYDTELRPTFLLTANITSILPLVLAVLFNFSGHPLASSPQQSTLIQCFSLLLLGAFLATLSTINFSLGFIVAVLCTPLSFVRRTRNVYVSIAQMALLTVLNPVMVVQSACYYFGISELDVLLKAAEGWQIWGMWTQVVVWLVWFPAWLAGTTVVAGGLVGN